MSEVEIVAKKPKMMNSTEITNSTNEAEQRCAHWVQRKKRFCKMTLAHGKKYCGEHEPATNEETTTLTGNRIPCPLDSKHTIYSKNLYKHLKICNARQKNDEPAYIQKALNAGDETPEALDYRHLKLSELAEEELQAVIDKIKSLYKMYVVNQIQTLQTQHKILNAELANQTYGKETRKHLEQTAALLGILDMKEQLQNSTSFVEFGAGKGQLAYYLAQLLGDYKNSQVILLDRMSLRHKKDNKIEDRSLVKRIRVDIADFYMDRLDLLTKTARTVAVSKHLCGAATDLTLRCILQPTNSVKATEFIMIALCCHHRCEWRSFVGKEFCQRHNIIPREFAIITKMVGWAICGTGMSRERRRELEQRVERALDSAEEGTTENNDKIDTILSETTGEEDGSVTEEVIGKTKETIKEAVVATATQLLTDKETSIVTKEADTNIDVSEPNKLRLTLAEREEIGFMCKRVLDHARLEYLRKNGYEASLNYYVPKDVTLENVCLLAKKMV
ncbi:tRNA:m(4)X modification enzyme TRM13-like [Teleopsis dalmanni]|uniref:tRNA:m(4)X modification enzyme TRM13-like n=1 Tax=Teleopsis dalmanni TaxID=139649 RepID=UPI0018CF960D|nr:tRNA:m(4)X modification enzyme TRM13-like [Teleopsis dalmanni]